MTLMSANDEQNGDDVKMMKRRTQGKQETQGKPGDYDQPHADWLLAAPTIQSSATSGHDLQNMGERKHTLYSTTLKLALQALCLPLPRFCADTTSHSRGCI